VDELRHRHHFLIPFPMVGYTVASYIIMNIYMYVTHTKMYFDHHHPLPLFV
jgi:hypothetical protein